MIIHGVKDVEDIFTDDKGFDYLVNQLAAEGYAAISINVSVINTFSMILDGVTPDIPLGIVYSELDEDVAGSDGQFWFDRTKDNAARKSPASIVYLCGGNHAYFNRNFMGRDETQEQQEDFAKKYFSSFLSVFSGHREPFGTFNVNEEQPNTMFGRKVTASYFAPDNVISVSAEKDNLF